MSPPPKNAKPTSSAYLPVERAATRQATAITAQTATQMAFAVTPTPCATFSRWAAVHRRSCAAPRGGAGPRTPMPPLS